MAFPAGPYTDGQTHTEFGVGFTYSAAAAAWLKDPPASGGGTITVIGGNVPQTRTVTGVNSVAGGGDLTADRTLALVNDAAAPVGLQYYGTNAAGVKGWYSIQPTQSSRNVLTANSITGGGNLTTDRTIQLVNDTATPGDNMFYGTNASGVRGWVQQSPNVPATRSITGTMSITGGGDLTADRTLSLVNDTATPGSSKMYGTDASGVKGWVDGPKPVTYASGQVNATQTVTPGGYYLVPLSASGITTGSDSFTLAANTTYTIDVGIFSGGSAPLRLKVFDRTNSVILATFRGATTLIYKPTVNSQISIQSDEAANVVNPSGYVSVFSS